MCRFTRLTFTRLLQKVRYTDNDNVNVYPSKRLKKDKDGFGEAGQDFLSLIQGTKREREEVEDDSVSNLGHFHAGVNEDPASSKKDKGRSEDEEASDEDAVSEQERLRERLKLLNTSLRARPSDVESWLSLVALQEDILDQSQQRESETDGYRAKGVKKLHSEHRAMLAEVQFAVIERAMKEHPPNASSLPLIKAKLDLAASSGAWQRQRIDKEWRQVITANSTDWQATVELWNAYLRWRTEDTDAFVLADVLNTLAEAIQDFSRHYFDNAHLGERATKELVIMDLFRRTVNIMLDAGFTERARGLLQAQIELSHHMSIATVEMKQESFNSSIRQLEDYWDLQEYRLGEVGYQSWKCFRNEANAGHSDGHANGKENTLMTFGQVPRDLNDADPVVRWLSLEKARARLRKMPAKYNEEADWQTGELEVDPFSFVLYSDLQPFLVPIMTSKGIDSLVKLLLASLGVYEMDNARQLIYSDVFWPSHLGCGKEGNTLELIGGQLMPSPKRSALSQPFRIPVKSWPIDVWQLYPVRSTELPPWFAAWDEVQNVEEVDVGIARRIFEDIFKPSTNLKLAHLGLIEVTQKHKMTTRLAKRLLREDGDNIESWRAYAHLERNNGNRDVVRTVYRSLLGADGAMARLACIWQDWADLEWQAGHHRAALTVLTKAVNAKFGDTTPASLVQLNDVSPTDILRTRKSNLEQAALSSDSNVIYCAALFTYLSEDQEAAFTSALQVFENSMTSTQADEALESIAMKHCRFIWRHIHGDDKIRRSRSYPAKKITETLSRYVLQFPHNTAFVALLAAFEMTTKVENVLRNVLEKKMQMLGEETREENWLVYIYCELHMNLHSVNENAVRRLFERATSGSR